VAWQQVSVTNDLEARRFMAHDLRSRILERGLTRDEVHALLGPPDDEQAAPDASGFVLTYHLGYPHDLDLHFDGNDGLVRSRVRYAD
jgi:hypothetical protein